MLEKLKNPLWMLSLASIFFLFNRTFELGIGLDSALYAGIARTLSQDFSIWNFKLTDHYFSQFYEHPPLVIIINSLLFKLIGANDVTARLVNIGFGFGMYLLCFKVGKNLINKSLGLLMFLSLLITQHFMALALTNFLDVGCAAFAFLGFYFIIKTLNFSTREAETQVTEPRSVYSHLALGSLCFSLALLSKGVFALAPLGGLGLYVLISKNTLKLKFSVALALVCSLILPAIYFWQQSLWGEYNFIWSYFNRHFNDPVQTGGGKSFQFGTFFAYLKIALPFSIAVMLALLTFWKNPKYRELWKLFVCMFFITFLFFSISKKDYAFYLAIFYPFHALMSGAYLYSIRHKFKWKDGSTMAQAVLGLSIFAMFLLHILPVKTRVDQARDITNAIPHAKNLEQGGLKMIKLFTSDKVHRYIQYVNWYWKIPIALSEGKDLDQDLASVGFMFTESFPPEEKQKIIDSMGLKLGIRASKYDLYLPPERAPEIPALVLDPSFKVY